MWNLKERKLFAIFKDAISFAFDPNGIFVAISYQNNEKSTENITGYINLHRLDKSLEKPLATYEIKDYQYSKISFSPNGMMIFCQSNSGILIVDAFTGNNIGFYNFANFNDFSITADSQYLALGSEFSKIEFIKPCSLMKSIVNFKHSEENLSGIKFGTQHIILASFYKEIAVWSPF